MAVELWTGRNFDTTHERWALDRLMPLMEIEFGSSNELYLVLADYFIEGKKVDLTILKKDAIIVIELKEFSKPFRATENGRWLTIPDKRDEFNCAEQNPYEQVNVYRRCWMSYLTNHHAHFLPPAKAKGMNFTHISAYVVISPTLHPETRNDIPSRVIWFRLLGINELPQAIRNQTSQKLNFSDADLRGLVGQNGLNLRHGRDVIVPPSYKQGNLSPKPNLLIGREQALHDLKIRLGVMNGRPPSSQILTAVRGWPGVGKTTLATALAHDPDVEKAFPDGVLWAALGENPDVVAQLLTWGRALGVDHLNTYKSIEEMSSKLRTLLRNSKWLLIIDDVWQKEHAIPLNIGGKLCATLMTTRFPDVANQLAPSANDIYHLDVLTEEQSLHLLAKKAPTVVEQYLKECCQLVRDLEGLPLALQVAGGLLNEEASFGWGVKELLAELQEGKKLLNAQAPADRIDVATQTVPTVAVLLKRSTDRLSPEIRDCFAFLGAFAPKPATFALDDMTEVWKVTDPKPIVRQLVNRGLLEPIAGRFQMHALLVLHAKSLCEG